MAVVIVSLPLGVAQRVCLTCQGTLAAPNLAGTDVRAVDYDALICLSHCTAITAVAFWCTRVFLIHMVFEA